MFCSKLTKDIPAKCESGSRIEGIAVQVLQSVTLSNQVKIGRTDTKLLGKVQRFDTTTTFTTCSSVKVCNNDEANTYESKAHSHSTMY